MATEQQVDEMILELRELVLLLEKTTSTGTSRGSGAAEFDRATKSIVNAIAKLSVTMNTEVRNRSQETRALKKFTDEVEQATKAQEEQAKSAEKAIKAEQERTRALEKSAEQIKKEEEARQARATRDASWQAAQERAQEKHAKTLRGYLERQAGDSIEAQKKIQTRLETLSTVGDVAKSMASFGKDLANGMMESGIKFSSLNPLIDAVSNALGKMAESIPIAGEFISGTMKAAAEGTKFILGQVQATVDAFTELSSVGGLVGDGMTGLQRQFLTSAMSLNGFKKAVVENSVALAQFGGTVGRGAEDFSKIVGSIMDSNVGDELRRLGFTADAFGESTAKYIGMQNRLGLAQGKTTEELARSSASYAKELDQLARLTGQSREAAQKQIDAALSESRFRATIEEMNANGQTETAKTLKFFQNQVSSVNDELGQAIRDASTGFYGSDALMRFEKAGVDVLSIVEGVKTGQLSAADAAKALQTAIGNVKDDQIQYNKFFQQGQSPFFDLAKSMDFLRANISEGGEVVREDQKKLAAGTDKLTADTADAQKSMEQLGRQMANFGINVMPAAVSAVSGFTKALNGFIKGVADATGMDLPTIQEGGGAAAGGGGGAGAGGGPGAPGGRGGAGVPTSGRQMISQAYNAQNEGEGGILGAVGRTIRGATRGFKDLVGGSAGTDFYNQKAPASSEQAILDLIGRVESRGNYNVLVGGKTKTDPPLTDMTVAEIMEFQKTMKAQGHETDAVGKYQIISQTMDWLVGSGAIKPTDVFDQSTQERAAQALLRRRGWEQFKTGGISPKVFADNLAMEWAALPMEDGGSYYRGKGSNKALVPRDEVMKAISAADGGIARGPRSGYRAILHGTEAVVPLPDGKNIPVTLKMPMNMGFDEPDILSELNQEIPAAIVGAIRTAMAEMRTAQAAPGGDASVAMLAELQNISNLIARQNSTSERILQVARN